MKKIHRWAWMAGAALFAVLMFSIGGLAWLWRDRADIADLPWPVEAAAADGIEAVTATWLGITTVLFDDGETQVLIDGTFTRVGLVDVLLFRPVVSDVATINLALAEYRMNRLAVIIPVHSHFDHAMDVGHVANRTTAVILGSESTANIAAGAAVPVDQYQILADGESRHFGEFTITLLASRHAPIGPGEEAWFPGAIVEPLVQPARISEWKEGVVYSVFIEHPRGTTLIQGSGGFIAGNLADRTADVVMLGVAGLARLGPDYVGQYWLETVSATRAATVYAIHIDDYTRPFGEVMLFPEIADSVLTTAGWIEELAQSEKEPVIVRRLPFGQRVALYQKRSQ